MAKPDPFSDLRNAIILPDPTGTTVPPDVLAELRRANDLAEQDLVVERQRAATQASMWAQGEQRNATEASQWAALDRANYLKEIELGLRPQPGLTPPVGVKRGPWEAIPTPREREMVRLWCEGYDQGAIARQYHLTTATVANIFAVLRAHYGHEVVPSKAELRAKRPRS